jgi:hypothetical protein
MDKIIAWHQETIGKKVVAALAKNNFSAEYAPDETTALERALAIIPQNATIGLGGSVSVRKIGLIDALKKRGNNVIDHNAGGLSSEEKYVKRRQEMTSDVFITSSNAVTLDGQLINVDGIGNRVAGLAFGPGKVLLVIGVNKIVEDVEAGLKRLRVIASPLNNKRLSLPNPCAQTGVCVNCSSPERICNITTITHKKPMQSDMHIIIVGENLGY